MNGKPRFRPDGRARPAAMDEARAEAMAIKALAFLGGSPERLTRFLEVSGLSPETLRAAARSPGFFAGLMDYLVSDEALLVAFAGEIGADPETVMAARHLLSPTEFPD
jgi:hypothetical protein